MKNLLASKIKDFFVGIYAEASSTGISATLGYASGVVTFFGVGIIMLIKAISSLSFVDVVIAGPIATVVAMVVGCVVGWAVSCIKKFFG